jgi:prolyl 4-hydroxylase
MYTVESSVAVSERLASVPGIRRIPSPEIDMYVLRDFLDERECQALCGMIERDRKPSRLLTSGNPDSTFRTSETCNLDAQDPVVRGVNDRLAALLGIDPSHGEALQGQRYGVGQEFKPHHDYLRTTEAYWDRQEKMGGQRTWTAMAFLNVPEAGGETYFSRIDLKIPPRTGSLVTWNNLDARGEPNPYSLHQGTPVLAGTKYIITKWYRERPWGVAS